MNKVMTYDCRDLQLVAGSNLLGIHFYLKITENTALKAGKDYI